MPVFDSRVDSYIEKSAPFAKPILEHLRELIHTTCPEVEETWKWSFPNYIFRGGILCSMAAFKEHCSFGFWNASLMEDPDGILEQVSEKVGMGHLGKIKGLEDLPNDQILAKYLRAAMLLNEEGKKVAKKIKAGDAVKMELKTPAYFESILNDSPNAKAVFDSFSYSNRKDYIEWFEEAKTDATRNKRVAQAVEWIAEGKTRHWKYKNC